MSRVERRKNKKKKFKKLLLVGIVGGIAAIYGGGYAFFSSHYLPNTKIENIDVSFKNIDSAKQVIEEHLADYQITVKEAEGEENISAQDAGLIYANLDSIEDTLVGQNTPLWFVEATKKHSYKQLETSVDQSVLATSITKLQLANPAEPIESTDAKITYNKKDKKFTIEKEALGNILDKEHFLTDVTEAICNLDDTISVEDGSYYVQPNITSDSEKLVETRKKMNSYLKGTVDYKDGGLEVKLTKADLAPMISYSDDYKVSIDKKKVQTFIEDKVCTKFNSIKGKIPSGLTSWKVDAKKETDKTIKNIKAGKATTRQPIYSKEGFNRENYSIGNTYLDVNISDQHMWYVEGGEVVFESNIVTGCIATGHQTPTGFYRIAYKQRDHLMVKYNSFVHYWMPYDTSVGIGFHDASWRSEFGGSIYKTNGSHGCINMPPSKAATLFSMVSSGTAVYVHY